jgi:hypothetical protein
VTGFVLTSEGSESMATQKEDDPKAASQDGPEFASLDLVYNGTPKIEDGSGTCNKPWVTRDIGKKSNSP